ncbi:MAG: branched-chain amino acid ABC transporter permease [Thermodesulfobacteriota bacterium]
MDLTTQALWQGVVNGLALGWIYVLMALGLTLIFGIMRIMQFAHGEIYMVGAYVVYYLTASFKLPLLPAAVLGMAAMAATGLALERLLFRPLKDDWLGAVVAATGLTLILQSGAVVVFGLYERSIPLLAQGPFNIMGTIVPKDRLVAVMVAVVLSLVLYAFLKMTRYGQAMVASAQSPEGAILQGISPDRMAALSMAIGCALAAAGGTLAGALFALSPFMGLAPLVKGCTIIVLGGMGSLPGAFIAGMMMGLIDGVVPILFGHAWAAIGPLLVVIVVLVIKPQGFFGHE